MKKLKTFEEYNSSNVDDLLDKINDKGIDSLTDKEREILKNNGSLPGEKEEKKAYHDSYDEDEDEELFYKSDLGGMSESDDITEEEVGSDWLERRKKARELYDFRYFKTRDTEDIITQFNDIVEYIEDDKNAPIFKEKVVNYYVNNIKSINKEIKHEKLNWLANYLLYKLDDIMDKTMNSVGDDDDDE